MVCLRSRLLLVMLVGMAISGCPLVSGFRVVVVNNLGDDTKLNIHCRSREVDLGNQVLESGGDLTWDFEITIGGFAHYDCDMSYFDKKGQFAVFDEDRDADRCADRRCIWRVDRDGLYLYIKDHDDYEKQFSWQ